MKRKYFIPILSSLLFLSSCGDKKDSNEEYSYYIDAKEIITNVDKVDIKTNQSFKIEASVSPDNATNKVINFEIDNTNIASVSASGVIKGKKAGQCNLTISVKYKDQVECKKIIPIVVTREDRNRAKSGTIKVDTKIDFASLIGTDLDVTNFNGEIYAPLDSTYNTNDDGLLETSINPNLLVDINFYGNIPNETNTQRDNRIYQNMQALSLISSSVNLLLSSIGSPESGKYANYASNISQNYLRLVAGRAIPIVGLHNAINNTPEQHSLFYYNEDYLSNAKLANTNCVYYSYQDNNLDSSSGLSSIMSLFPLINVDTIEQYVTKENLELAINSGKDYFNRIPNIDNPYFQIIKVFVNNIDINSFKTEPNLEDPNSEDYFPGLTQKSVVEGKKAITVNLELTKEGVDNLSNALVEYINERINQSDDEDIKNRVQTFISSFKINRFDTHLTLVDRKSGGVDLYKINNETEFSTNDDSEQYLYSEIYLGLDEKTISSTFFNEEKDRQAKYLNPNS